MFEEIFCGDAHPGWGPGFSIKIKSNLNHIKIQHGCCLVLDVLVHKKEFRAFSPKFQPYHLGLIATVNQNQNLNQSSNKLCSVILNLQVWMTEYIYIYICIINSQKCLTFFLWFLLDSYSENEIKRKNIYISKPTIISKNPLRWQELKMAKYDK